MIHSSSVDNWQRIKIMHSIANDLHLITRENKFRNIKNNISDDFYFDAIAFETIQKESCIVEMIMAWCVITLESQVNHAIAATESDKEAIIRAIEYSKGSVSMRDSHSELAKKLLILARTEHGVAAPVEIADNVSEIRNEIVHDKPVEIVDRDDGDIEIRYFRVRGKSDGKRYRFEDLGVYYEKCQKICDFIELYHVYLSPMGERVHFRF
ncbi:hypothetical protein [Desulfobulbus sp.]|uniref:hypothetical protein n=1 Tax=Desulfobulbus sp. TaxID=895 RepID=UPI0027BADB3C|nr:hypothetical protein [Desulfobulbus sp.]